MDSRQLMMCTRCSAKVVQGVAEPPLWSPNVGVTINYKPSGAVLVDILNTIKRIKTMSYIICTLENRI